MPKIVMEEVPEFPIIPADTIVSVEVVSVDAQEPNEFRTWPTLSFRFRVTDAPSNVDASLIGTSLWGQVNPRLTDHPDNKLRQWLGALLGFEPEVGFELDTDDLTGRTARAIVDVYEGKKGKKNKVTGLIPAGTASVSATSAPASNDWSTPTAGTGGTSSWDSEISF